MGAIGLLQYTSPALPDPGSEDERPGIGDVILVINASDLEPRIERVRATPGVKIASEPQLIEYPAPDGKGTIPVRVSAVWDPDGYFIELNSCSAQRRESGAQPTESATRDFRASPAFAP